MQLLIGVCCSSPPPYAFPRMQISQCPSQKYNQTLESHSLSVLLHWEIRKHRMSLPLRIRSSEKICNIPDLKADCQILPSLNSNSHNSEVHPLLKKKKKKLFVSNIHSSLPQFILWQIFFLSHISVEPSTLAGGQRSVLQLTCCC